jgi:NTE family protein
VREVSGGIDVGREISNWGEIRVGMHRGTGRRRVLIGDPSLPSVDFDRGGYFTRFSYDKLDSIFFPRHGQQFDIEWRAERESIGAETDFDILRANWLVARSFNRHTLIFWTDAGTTVDALETPENSFTLGGFLNLSGLSPGFLAAPHYGIGRLIYYRRIGRGGEGVLDLPAYAGLSLEAGNTWPERDAMFSDMRINGSVFFGLDTPLGPVYLATGFDEGGDKAFYLFLGRTF